jgi:methylated-DNA-[protein]-cysteine S-methyltransferase
MKGLVIETELGWIGLALNGCGLCAVTLPTPDARQAEEQLRRQGVTEPLPEEEARGWPEKLRRYARGESTVFDGETDLSRGTQFQQTVWRALLDIPCGETRTYGQIADQIGRPRVMRAVGQAVGANPLPVVVPCHRVVAANGLGGFGGGLALKKKLLRLEAPAPSKGFTAAR